LRGLIGRRLFIDANVLALFVLDAPRQAFVQATRTELVQAGHELWISRQVLRELAAALVKYMRRDGRPTMDEVCAALDYARHQYFIAEDSAAVTAQHLELLKQHPECRPGQVHDLNIIATIQAHGIAALVTFDKDFTVLSAGYELILLSS